MEDPQAVTWLRARFGADGPLLRTAIPDLLWTCHEGMADAQQRAPIDDNSVYGNMWRAVHHAIEREFGQLPTAQLYRPHGAPYKIVVVNGTALFPWRFAHDAVTDLDEATLGPHVSPTRQSILRGVALPEMLPFGNEPVEEMNAELVEEEAQRYREDFRHIAAEHPVVVLAYASNPAALLSAYWGDVMQLRADGTLRWGRRETFDLTRRTPGRRLAAVCGSDGSPSDGSPGFGNAPLQIPPLYPRRTTTGEQHEAPEPGSRA